MMANFILLNFVKFFAHRINSLGKSLVCSRNYTAFVCFLLSFCDLRDL